MDIFLQIPSTASDKHIREQIHRGFPAAAVVTLFDSGAIDSSTRDRIIPLRTLNRRLTQSQRLTHDESGRLFRVSHIIALAQALFNDPEKATRWLAKPKGSLSGSTPLAMLATPLGMRAVEEMLVRIGEGFAF
ncbi:antitoxin Xre/MbcA/ParS toxin-binding domain-containing protein [Pseudomonas syringae]|nr:antitoxin Xre/MbcA/ParS toxin-binding domain-containing protein [Pseudomonas syringae]